MTLAQRYPTFLYDALKLQEAKIPIDLDASIIQSTIDAYQNGWALAVYNHRKFTFSPNFAFSLVLIGDTQFPPPQVGGKVELRQAKVLGIDLFTDVSITINAQLKYRKINGEPLEVVLRSFDILTTDSVHDWIDDIMDNAQASLWKPPGWQLVMDFTASGVAEDQIVVQILWAEIPAGFNIGFT